MKKLLAASALTMCMIASQANAEQWPRWYVGLTGGMSFLSDNDIKNGGGKVSYDDGFSGDVAIGYMAPFPGAFSNIRLEAELGYRTNSVDRVTSGTNSGELRNTSYMGNVYYDFRSGSQWTPYIGAGAGETHVSLSKSTGLGMTDDSDNEFAYQFMAGIGYAPTSMPMTEWNLGYRYFGSNAPTFSTPTGRVKLDRQMAQSAEIGAKFRF